MGTDGVRRVKPPEFLAPCPRNYEAALADELKALGAQRVRPLAGSVSFSGDIATGMRACLWSRLASRVILVVKRVDAGDAEQLYEGIRRIHWEDHVAPGATIAVSARGGNDELHDARFTGLRVKDAIVDRLRDCRGARPDVDPDHPDVLVTCNVHGDRATIGIDFAGESLVNRGYRVRERNRASSGRTTYLREDLAAFMLAQAGWPRRAARDARSMVVDPLGTSPVLAIEAACIACDRAPGLTRSHWGFEGWAGFDEDAWAREVALADDRLDAGLATGTRVIFASDDPGVREELAEIRELQGFDLLYRLEACPHMASALGVESSLDDFH